MKKKLLIIFSVFIFLAGCSQPPTDTPDDTLPTSKFLTEEIIFRVEEPIDFTNISSAERDEIRALFEDRFLAEIDSLSTEGNLEAEGIFLSSMPLSEALSCYLDFTYGNGIFYSDKINIVKGSQLYPNSSDEYVYAIFDMNATDSASRITACSFLNLEKEELSIKFQTRLSTSPDGSIVGSSDIIHRTVVLKIKAAALNIGAE